MRKFRNCILGIAALGIFGATYANAFKQNGYTIPKEKLNQTPPVAFEERTPPQWKGGKTDVISLFSAAAFGSIPMPKSASPTMTTTRNDSDS